MSYYIVNPPPLSVVSVTKGTDCRFTLRRKDATTGDPVDWGADVYISIDIDKSAPTQVDAAVSGSDAAVRIEADTADQVKTGTAWRAVMSIAGTPSLEKPVMVGFFERHDGGKQ